MLFLGQIRIGQISICTGIVRRQKPYENCYTIKELRRERGKFNYCKKFSFDLTILGSFFFILLSNIKKLILEKLYNSLLLYSITMFPLVTRIKGRTDRRRLGSALHIRTLGQQNHHATTTVSQ